jgi:hypothetical protein
MAAAFCHQSNSRRSAGVPVTQQRLRRRREAGVPTKSKGKADPWESEIVSRMLRPRRMSPQRRGGTDGHASHGLGEGERWLRIQGHVSLPRCALHVVPLDPGLISVTEQKFPMLKSEQRVFVLLNLTGACLVPAGLQEAVTSQACNAHQHWRDVRHYSLGPMPWVSCDLEADMANCSPTSVSVCGCLCFCVCVCMCVRACVRVVCVRVCACVRACVRVVRVCVCVYVCVCAHALNGMCVCVCVCACMLSVVVACICSDVNHNSAKPFMTSGVCVRAYVRACVRVCGACVRSCVCVCACALAQLCACMRACVCTYVLWLLHVFAEMSH